MARAIVQFTPPHNGGIWYGRCDHAVELQLELGGKLVLAGDANGGSDLELFRLRAIELGVDEDNIILAFNGHDKSLKNTRGDARASASKITDLDNIDEVIVVTCWYHAPRALIALDIELQTLGLTKISVRTSVVEPNIEVTDEILANEMRGCCDYLLGRPQVTRGEVIGKPDFQAKPDQAMSGVS